MIEKIFSFQINNWLSVLLAAFPALFNIAIAVYIKRRLPRSGTTRLFFLLLLCVISWQFSDILTRINTNETGAAFWDAVLSTGWIYVAPFGLHFALHFTGRQKMAESAATKFLLYLPATFFDALYKLTFAAHTYVYVNNWGWVDYRKGDLLENAMVDWMAGLALITSAILIVHTIRVRKNELAYKRSLIIAAGFTISVLQAIITEILIPVIYNTPPITITSTFFSFFSIGTAIALRKYKLFQAPDFIDKDMLLDVVDDIVITASRNHTLTYINNYGAKNLGLAKEKISSYTLTDLFPTQALYIDFLKNASTPESRSKDVQNFETTLVSRKGQPIQVLLSTKNIAESSASQNILIVARDVTGLKNAQASIEANEKRFRAIIENSNDALVMFSPDGTIIYNSPSISPLLGFANGELKGRNVYELIHEDDKEQITEKLILLRDTPGLSVNMKLQSRNKAGHWLWIEGTCTNLINEPGVNAIVGNFRNITERIRIENDKEEALALFDSIIKNVNAGILIEDEKHNIYFLNEDFYKIFSLNQPLDTLIGENAILLSGQYRELVKAPNNFATELYAIAQARQPVLKQEVIFTDGHIYELDYMPIYTQNNVFIGHFWKYNNVTERVRTLENIQKQTAYMQQLYNASPYGIVMLDIQDVVLTANSAFEKLFGFSVAEMEGKPINSIIVPPHLQEEASLVSKNCFQKQAVQLESKRMRKDGTLLDVLIVGYPIVIDDEYCGVYGIYEDISERKKAEDELVTKNIQLQKINKELDQFVYSASHDIRAPLMSILGLINLSESTTENKELLQYFDMMRTSINKLDGFITDIIHFSKNAQTEIQPEEITLKPFIQDIYNQLRFLKKTRELHLFIKESADNTIFYSDRTRLGNIFTNLISNAIKYHNYNQPNPYIEVSLVVNEYSATIIIRDNGTGIAAEKQSFIFDMFYRADETSTGSGLGLYIVKEIVEKLNGSINVSSLLGEGTTFEIILPNILQPALPQGIEIQHVQVN
jgi:PAS domain S-box-containing protein